MHQAEKWKAQTNLILTSVTRVNRRLLQVRCVFSLEIENGSLETELEFRSTFNLKWALHLLQSTAIISFERSKLTTLYAGEMCTRNFQQKAAFVIIFKTLTIPMNKQGAAFQYIANWKKGLHDK